MQALSYPEFASMQRSVIGNAKEIAPDFECWISSRSMLLRALEKHVKTSSAVPVPFDAHFIDSTRLGFEGNQHRLRQCAERRLEGVATASPRPIHRATVP